MASCKVQWRSSTKQDLRALPRQEVIRIVEAVGQPLSKSSACDIAGMFTEIDLFQARSLCAHQGDKRGNSASTTSIIEQETIIGGFGYSRRAF